MTVVTKFKQLSEIDDPRRRKELEKLVKQLGLIEIKKVNWSLLNLALTHPNISKTENYQQLEFVGDAVLRLAAAQVLYYQYHDYTVGQFAQIRSILVSDRTLVELAQYYDLESYLLINQRRTNQSISTSVLADLFEAILGALYLSTDSLELINSWFTPILARKIKEIREDPSRKNYKDALQNWTQGKDKTLPIYHTTMISPSAKHPHYFQSEVWFRNQKLGTGTGKTKKDAEQAAAQQAFSLIDQFNWD